jgi:membrane protein YqaA with SNARE-associated domain
MGNAASKAGWLIFVFALAGAVLHTGPDDPITAGMKSSGVYQPLMVLLSVVLVLLLVWLACMMKKTVAMRRHLDELKRKGR